MTLAEGRSLMVPLVSDFSVIDCAGPLIRCGVDFAYQSLFTPKRRARKPCELPLWISLFLWSLCECLTLAHIT